MDLLYKTIQTRLCQTRLLVTDVPPAVDYSDLISVFPVPQVFEPLCCWREKKNLLGANDSQRGPP